MNLQNSFSQLESLLTPASQVLILIGADNIDHLTAGISLGLSLEKSSKQVSIFAPHIPETGASAISGLEKVRTGFGQKDLFILFDYPLDGIEKVSSQEENNRLKLVVKMKPEVAPIKTDQVKVVSQNFDYDVGLVIGDESFFPGFSQLASRTKWIWLGKDNQLKSWAQISLTDPGSSFSEMAARIIQSLGLPMDQGIAGNLYQGIKKTTGSFENLSSYKTLEAAALCYKVFQGNKLGGAFQESSREEEKREIKPEIKEPTIPEIPIGEVENKEGGAGSLPTPRIFKGATTPRV